MDSPTGIIPEDLMFRERRREVRAFIIGLALPGHIKREILFAWSRTVAVRLTAREVQEVTDSGIQPAK